MKVIGPRTKSVTKARQRGLVATPLADDFETRDRAERFDPIDVETPVQPDPPQEPAPAAKPTRMVALDAFRGLTVLLMLIVNNIALDTFTPDAFTHAAWNQGLRLADFVFPWFLLCVGLAIPFSFASFKKTGLPSWRYDLRIVIRTAALVFLGCLVNAAISRQVVFTLGVLQLIGLGYLIAAFAYELPIVRRCLIATMMLTVYALAIKMLPFPGAAVGTFREDANFIDHINKAYLLRYNLDGAFSVVPTSALMIFATVIGDALVNKKINPLQRLAMMGASGVILIGAGIGASFYLPYNKPVWTPSYLLLTGGAGVLVLAGFYLFTDAVKWSKWPYPLLVLGSNAILAYVLPVICKVMVFASWNVPTAKGKISLQEAFLNSLVDRFGRLPGGWIYTWVYIGCWWLILLMFYKRKAFVRV